jgi:hypothetical protein
MMSLSGVRSAGLVLLALLAISACSESTAANRFADPQVGTYRDAAGWAIEVPAGWHVVRFSDSKGGVTAAGAQISNARLPAPTVEPGYPIQVNGNVLPSRGVGVIIGTDRDPGLPHGTVVVQPPPSPPGSSDESTVGSALAGQSYIETLWFRGDGKTFIVSVKVAPEVSSAALKGLALIVRSVRLVHAAAKGFTYAAGRPTAGMADQAACKALALWASFPVQQRPRPIVIPVGPGIVNPPRNTNEDLALYRAAWKFTAPLPRDVATARGEHLITADAAISALISGMKRAPVKQGVLNARLRLGQASFVTDRGRLRLPAWLFYFGRFAEPASVLAVTPYNAPALRRIDPQGVTNSLDGEQAVVSADGKTLRIFFTGGPAGNKPCDDRYTATIRQSTHVVAFTIREFPVVDLSHNVACSGVGYTKERGRAIAPAARAAGARGQHRRRSDTSG